MPPGNALVVYEPAATELEVGLCADHGPRAFPMAEFLKFIGKK